MLIIYPLYMGYPERRSCAVEVGTARTLLKEITHVTEVQDMTAVIQLSHQWTHD